ncbi:tRNA (adenosine(37)-N6)-dimethylallyltransferase MiaA [Sulfurospirillum sp. 1307]
MREIAILGPTASGKTALSINLANQLNANILSLDSLSIYKEIDIVSAKPTKEERGNIPHFGIDEIRVDEPFNVTLFFELYKKAKKESLNQNKNLIIVGGTSFYLKSMLDGISPKPSISKKTKMQVKENLKNGYEIIKEFDKVYAEKIDKNDSYRIEKWLEIFYETQQIPTVYFQKNQKQPIIKEIELFEIDIPKEILRDKIYKRTELMVQNGLIDEIVFLEKKYTRQPNPMKAIGIKETLDFLDGKLSKKELIEQISIHTAQLAKRQKTFNQTQFKEHFKGTLKEILSQFKAF